MLLSDFHPWPYHVWPAPVPEITDAELRAIDLNNPRASIEELLRTKRAPEDWHLLARVELTIRQKLYAAGNSSLDHHLTQKRNVRMWGGLASSVMSAREALLAKVVVKTEELDALITRWLLLQFTDKPEPIQEIEGRTVRNGIIQPTPGGRPQ
jgi:hypothetical protein